MNDTTTFKPMSTNTHLNELAAALASNPDTARLTLKAAWHPDMTDKEFTELKRRIRKNLGFKAQ